MGDASAAAAASSQQQNAPPLQPLPQHDNNDTHRQGRGSNKHQHKEKRSTRSATSSSSDSSRSPSPAKTVSSSSRHRHHNRDRNHRSDMNGSSSARSSSPPTLARDRTTTTTHLNGYEPAQRSSGGCWRFGFVLFATIIIALLAVMVGLQYYRKPEERVISQTIYPIADLIPTRACLPIDKLEILEGAIKDDNALNGTLVLADIRNSLIYQSDRLHVDGMCAQHLDKKKHCYCVMKLANGEYLDMYNLDMKGASFDERKPVSEASVFCKREVDTWRWQKIWVSYMDKEGTAIGRLFEGGESFVLQHLLLVLRGLSHCEDNNDSALLADLRNRLNFLTNVVLTNQEQYSSLLGRPVDGSAPAVGADQRRLGA